MTSPATSWTLQSRGWSSRQASRSSASGRLGGMTRASMTRENLARSAVLSVADSLADCLDILRGVDVVQHVLLIGGGAKSDALCSVFPDTLGMPVTVLETGEYVALGAARQKAWAAGEFPRWSRSASRELRPSDDAGVREFRRRYGLVRRATEAELA
nr:FGGY-family carbohydrate kinase [Kocuria sp. ICS0012]